jgi:hypothetical protein
MYNPPRKDFEAEAIETSPLRGLLIAVPIGVALWFAIYALVRFFA